MNQYEIDDDADKIRKDLISSWDEYFSSESAKELMKAMQDDIDKLISQSFFRVVQNNWGPSPVSVSWSHNSPTLPPLPYGGISPTDVDAKGMYEYQEPEVDEQGTYYGYKVLNQSGYIRGGEITLKSPRYPAEWLHGECRADATPDENHMHGLHFTKRIDHPELRNYFSSWENSVVVRCALSDTVIETEQGFRAEYAQIVGVYINGNWQSYQDYQERTKAHSGSISDQEEIGWRYINYKPRQSGKGNWITFDFGPNP